MTMISNRKWHVPVFTAALVVGLAGCTGTTDGTALTDASPTTSRAAVTTTTTTTAPFVAESPDEVVRQVIGFWGTKKIPLSLDTGEQSVLTCVGEEFQTADALFCDSRDGDTITWTPGFTDDMGDDEIAEVAGRITLAHEVGHAVQDAANKFQTAAEKKATNPDGVKYIELSADCLAGFYIAHNTDVNLDSTTITAALNETVLADSPARIDAFERGQGLEYNSPNTCLVEYASS